MVTTTQSGQLRQAEIGQKLTLLQVSREPAHMHGTANSAYAASKTAVESFGRSMRSELVITGTSASMVCSS